jgi:2-polyprenyl-3-methyl-5-hydroxy-6-metoxy-1,4-benzoquinol methylase
VIAEEPAGPAHALDVAEPARYWETRAHQFARRGAGLAAVCSYGMPGFYNRAIAFVQRRALAPWLRGPERGFGIEPRATALDVGCGVGRWSVQLARVGYRVTGFDLSSNMIARARERAASLDCEFSTGDAAQLELGRRFDLILCVTVLQHIVAPSAARQAIGRLATHLQPGGRLVLLEAAPSRECGRCDSATFTARTADWYLSALRSAGLHIVVMRGVDPIPLKVWLLPYYRQLPPLIRIAALALATSLSLPLDLVLAPIATTLSWHKVIVASR